MEWTSLAHAICVIAAAIFVTRIVVSELLIAIPRVSNPGAHQEACAMFSGASILSDFCRSAIAALVRSP